MKEGSLTFVRNREESKQVEEEVARMSQGGQKGGM